MQDRADGKYYKKTKLDYPVEDLLQEVMNLYPSEDKVSEWNWFPIPEEHVVYSWMFDPLPEHIKDAIERTTGENLVPGMSYLNDFRDMVTNIRIHKDPRWTNLGLVPPKLTMVCLDGFTKLEFWTGRNGTEMLDSCIYGPGDVITFDATNVYQSTISLLPYRRKRNIHCHSYGGEDKPFVVQYSDLPDKYDPWVKEFIEKIKLQNNYPELDKYNSKDPRFETWLAFDKCILVSISVVEIIDSVGVVRTYDVAEDDRWELLMQRYQLEWAKDNLINIRT